MLGGGSHGGGLIGNGSIVGTVTGSINKTLDVTVSRSFDRRTGSVSANAGLAGTVHSVANATVGANGLGKGIGLAGSSSTDASANKQAGIGITGVGTNHAKSLAGQVSGTANAVVSKTHGSPDGQGGSKSLTGSLASTANGALAITNSSGQGGGKSITGTVGSATQGALALTKSHGSDGQDGSKSLTGSLASTTNGALAITKTHGPSGGQSSSGGKDKAAKGASGQRADNGAPQSQSAAHAPKGAYLRPDKPRTRSK